MKIFYFVFLICAANTIDAATVALNQCELDKLIFAYTGACWADSQALCEDVCTGIRVESEEDCIVSEECCWNGNACMMKSIPIFEHEVPKEEFQDHVEETVDVEKAPEEGNLKRIKRQAGGGFSGSLKRDGYGGWTASGRGYQDIGRNGRITADGSYHHPTGAWGANVGYEHKIRGGHISVGGGISRDPFGRQNHQFGIGFTKRWGRRK